MNQLTDILNYNDYDFNPAKILKFEQDFQRLKFEFDDIDDDRLNDDDYRAHLANAFDGCMHQLGFEPFDTDAYADLLFRIYQIEEYSNFMVFVAIAYQTYCDDDRLSEITYQVYHDVEHEHDEHE